MKFIKTRKSVLQNIYTPIFILICTSAVGVTNGQPPPSLNEPFPENPGPEVPKTTPPPYRGCPAECDARLTQAMALIADLEKRVSVLNITVNSRLNKVPTGGKGNSGELSSRVINIENYLYGNMTILTNKLGSDLESTKTTLSQNITDTRNYLNSRINTISSTPARISSGGSSPSVFTNITLRLDKLEFDKVQTLIDENNVWRQNFEVVNKTFSKMRKSSYSNDVIVVG